MNQKREEIIKQLEDFIEQGGDAEAFHKVAQQAMYLRPLPRDLLLKLLQRHSKVGKKMATPEGREEMENHARKIVNILGQPSKRIADPNDVVAKAANAIKMALPEFKKWKIDLSKTAKSMVQIYTGDIKISNIPPGFSEGIPGSFYSTTKAGLFQDQDGSIRNMYELSLNRGKPPSNEEIRKCGRLSDVLFLIWMREEVVELHSVEEMLRQLAKKIIPNMKIDFMPYDEPRYRSGLRMEFKDIAVPAAIGGVCSEWYNVPNDVTIASVQIFLEAWATAQSSQVVELTKLAPFFKQFSKKNNTV